MTTICRKSYKQPFPVVLENSNVEKLASNLYLSVHSLPQEGHDETDDASAGEV